MPCACGAGKNAPAPKYTVSLPGGETKTFSTEVEAAAAARRGGGSYKKS